MVVGVVCRPQTAVLGVLLQEVLQLRLLGLGFHKLQSLADGQFGFLLAVHHDVAVLVEFVQLPLLLWGEFYLRWVGVVPLLPLQGSPLACLGIGKRHRRTECIVLKGLHVAIYRHKLAVGQRLQFLRLWIIVLKQTELGLVFRCIVLIVCDNIGCCLHTCVHLGILLFLFCQLLFHGLGVFLQLTLGFFEFLAEFKRLALALLHLLQLRFATFRHACGYVKPFCEVFASDDILGYVLHCIAQQRLFDRYVRQSEFGA